MGVISINVKLIWLLTSCMTLFIEAFAQQVALVKPAQLIEQLSDLHKQPAMQAASLGFCLVDPETGKELAAYNAGQSLATASSLKAITTASSLALLGEDFQFETHLEADGKVQSGILEGNLFIRGGGDPSLGANGTTALFEAWVKAIKAKGIRKIGGRVVADASIFETQLLPDTWIWEDIGNYYGAGASGLSVLQNTYHLILRPGAKEGDPVAVVATQPLVPGLVFLSEMTTGAPGSGDNGYIYGAPYTYQRYLRGTIPAGVSSFQIKGSIPDPAYFLAWAFDDYLQKNGIEVAAAPTTLRLSGKSQFSLPRNVSIFTTKSAPLSQLIKDTNFKSINLYAEAMLKMISAKTGDEGSTEAGVAMIKDFWTAQGVDTKGFHMADGSGLSRFNALTPRQIAYCLAYTSQQPYGKTFLNSLPVSGQSGTMKNVAAKGLTAGKINAKSGYIDRVRAYCGFVKTLSGKELAFSILVNNHDFKYAELTRELEKLFNSLVLFYPTE